MVSMDFNMMMGMTMIGAVIVMVIVSALIVTHQRYMEANHELQQMQQKQCQQDSEFQWLEDQESSASLWQDHAKTEANQLFQEQLSMKLEAMDACKTMLREAMSHQNNNRM